MKFRKKISFYIIVLKILLVPLAKSFPQTFSKNSCVRNKKLPLLLSADIFPVTETNDDIWNLEPEYKTFNYPEVKCSLTSKSKYDLLGTKTRTPFQCKSRSKYLSKYGDNLKRLKTDFSNIESKLPSEFSSDPNYRDIANFPEVEYPLKASEIWKPNYWNSATDFAYRNVNANNYCIKPTLNEYFKPVKKIEKKFEPRPRTTSIKTVVNSKKNNISLKKEKNYTTTTVNEFQKENNTLSLNSSYVDTFREIVNPSVSPSSQGNKLKDEFIYDVCPIDPKVLDRPTEKCFKSDIASNLTAQSKLLVSEYAKKFKDEMKHILQSVADDIILNNFEFTNDNVMPPTPTIKRDDILKSTTRNHDLNIYNEFASPDLLKNRRSQIFNEFTNNDKDSFLSGMNLKPKLTSIDTLIKTDNSKFKEDMTTTIIQSNAENYLPNTIESPNDFLKTNINYNNLINEMDYPRLEPKNTQFTEDWQKTQLSLADVMVNTQVDKLNDDMTRKLRTKAENTFLKPHENYYDSQVTGQPLCACNNDKFYYNSKLRTTDCLNLNKNNKEMSVLKPLSENAINDFRYSTKLTEEAINNHVDNLHNEMTRKIASKADIFLLKPYDYCYGQTIGAQLCSDNSDNHNYDPKLTYIKDLTNLNPISTKMSVLKEIPENISVDKLHNEVIRTSKSKTETVFSKPFESSYNRITENQSDNDKLTCFPKLDPFDELIKNATSKEVIHVPKSDNVIKTCDPYKTKLKGNDRQSQYKNWQKQTDLPNKCKPTQAPQFPDILRKTNNNDDTSNVKEELNNESRKTPITCENLLPTKNKTFDNEAPVTCVNDKNDINNNDKEDEMFLPGNDKERTALCDDSMEKEIEIDEDFTTDSYPEDEGGDWSSYALSTVAPRTSTVDILFRDTCVIEPDKSISYPDELEQYFLIN